MKTTFLTSAIFFFNILFFTLHAQDIIIKKNKEVIHAKILEIGIDEIKYKQENYPDGPVLVISKSEVAEVTFASGNKMNFLPDPYEMPSPESVRHKSHSVKIEFFSPLTNDVAFSYETMLKPGMNVEVKAAIIGVGFSDDDEKTNGYFAKAGLKFITSRDYGHSGNTISHPLYGSYIKPEIIFSHFTKDNYYRSYLNPSGEKLAFNNYAINIVFGKQLLIQNVLTIDYYAGLGYAFQTNNLRHTSSFYYDDSAFESYAYSHIYSGKEFPLAISAGMTVGFIF